MVHITYHPFMQFSGHSGDAVFFFGFTTWKLFMLGLHQNRCGWPHLSLPLGVAIHWMANGPRRSYQPSDLSTSDCEVVIWIVFG